MVMKKKIINFSIFIISTFITLFIVEIIFQVFIPQNVIYYNSDVWQPADTIGWRHHVNANTTINLGNGTVQFVSDQYGYRVNPLIDQVDKKNADKNILVLGDSFLEAIQIENKDAIPTRLQNQLKNKGFNTYFYNSAVAGWSPNQYYLEAKNVLEKENIDVDYGIVFLYIGNDIIKNNIPYFQARDKFYEKKFHMPRKLTWASLKYSFFYPLNDFLEQHSHLFLFLKKKNKNLLAKLGLTPYRFPNIFQLNEKESESWNITTKVCTNISQVFESKKIPVIFVLIPTAYQVNQHTFQEYKNYFNINVDSIDLKQPNTLLKEKLRANSLKVYDPLVHLQNKSKALGPLYNETDGHFTPEGHRVLSSYLLPILQDLLQDQ